MMRWRHDPRWAYVFVNLATLFWAGNATLGRALYSIMSRGARI